MQITIDDQSGFCFGVVYAIQMAEDELDDSGTLYCLGDIVHNDLEVIRLNKKGLKIINHEDLKDLKDCKVLIRAHGEPPETYRTALENNIELIDASCPVVLKLQNRIKDSYVKQTEADAQVVIYGKHGHPEVIGLLGQTDNKAIVVFDDSDLEQIDFRKPIQLFSQTTKSMDGFYKLKSKLEMRAAEYGNYNVTANDTLCRQVSNREPHLKKFAPQFDVIVFVAGKKSSNGKVLYDVCKSVNPNSFFVSLPEEIDENWFKDAETVGICGATSTPQWLMEEIAGKIQTMKEAV
ncbi:MAG: 4-hydroxy-3-methylbut-2-enyl diphosphate reductase [Chitinophagaceae bacterium]|nr:MAG: 4-hydroxy-3-methylbut-2-enyl diphosphate reductase [Chitinophagaceae bacterium]